MSRIKSVAEIRRWLVKRVAQRLHVRADEIDTQDSFANHGLDSLDAAAISAEIATWLGCRLPVRLLWGQRSVDALAQHLAEESIRTSLLAQSQSATWDHSNHI